MAGPQAAPGRQGERPRGTRLRRGEARAGVGRTPQLAAHRPRSDPARGTGPGRRRTGAGRGQTRVGEIFKVAASGARARYYQLRKEGLAPLTATGAALVLGDPETKQKTYGGGSAAARSLGTDALNGNLAKDPGPADRAEGMPEAPPEPVDLGTGQTPCVGCGRAATVRG